MNATRFPLKVSVTDFLAFDGRDDRDRELDHNHEDEHREH